MNWFRKFWAALNEPPRATEGMHNFTPRSQQVLALAREEADRFNHNFVGTEHLLLGLIRLGQGVAVNVLQKMGLDLETVRRELEEQVGTGPDQKLMGNIPYTPRVKKVLALASKEAKALNHTYVGTEHILLGLLREGDGVAARLLKNLDVDIEQTRQEILRELDPNFDSKTVIETIPSKEAQMDTLNNFTPRAQQVLALARQAADRLHHNFVGAEHLLLGLVALGQGNGVKVLARMGVELNAVQKAVETQVGKGPDQVMTGYVPYTPRVKKILAFAAQEARALNHTYVGTEHMLLGILRERESVAARVLLGLNLNIEEVRLETLRELDPNLAVTTADGRPATAESARSANHDTVDPRKGYDIYCRAGPEQVVYRNARFKGIKRLFPRASGFLPEFIELELADGQTIYVAVVSIVKFTEHADTSTPGADSAG